MDSTNNVVAYLNENLYSENELIENDITQIEIVSSEKPQKLTNGCKIFKIYNNISSCLHFLNFLYRIYQHQQSTKRDVFFPVVEQIFNKKINKHINWSSYYNFLKNEIFLVIHKNQFSEILPLIKWKGEKSNIFKKDVYYQYISDSDERFLGETIDIILSSIDPMKKHKNIKLESLDNDNQSGNINTNVDESFRLVFVKDYGGRLFVIDKIRNPINKLIDSKVEAILCPVGWGNVATSISKSHSIQVPLSENSKRGRNMPAACFGIDVNNKQLLVPENIFEYHLKFLIEILYEKDLEILKDYNAEIRIKNSTNTDNNGLPQTIYYEYCSPTYQYSYLRNIIDKILIDIAPRSYHIRVKPDGTSENTLRGSYLFYFAFVCYQIDDDQTKRRLAELINAGVNVVLCFFGGSELPKVGIQLDKTTLNPVIFPVFKENLKLEEYPESIENLKNEVQNISEKSMK